MTFSFLAHSPIEVTVEELYMLKAANLVMSYRIGKSSVKKILP